MNFFRPGNARFAIACGRLTRFATVIVRCAASAAVLVGGLVETQPLTAAAVLPIHPHSVAQSGQWAPGLPAGSTLNGFAGAPAIENGGAVAFVATAGAASSIWVGNENGLRIIAQTDNPAPTTGASFADFSDVVINDEGATAFKATLAGAATSDENRDSIWLESSGNLAIVARGGYLAPDPAANLHFVHFETPIALNDRGLIAFYSRTRDKEQGNVLSSGLWTAGRSGLLLAADAGGPAVIGQAGVEFSPQSFEQPFSLDPVISPGGQTIFRGFLAGLAVDESNEIGLWSYRESTGLQLLARAGDEAVGAAGKTFVSFPGRPTIDAAGDTVFAAFYRTANDPGAANATPEFAIWLRRASGALSRIFTIGDDAPGTAVAKFVDAFDPVMNAGGHVALLAAVHESGPSSPGETGLWSNAMSPDDNLRLVARQGAQAPGTEDGFLFGAFLEPSLNAAGQSVFMASGYRQENGNIVDSAFGIWGQDRAGQLRLVVREGQLIEVSLGDLREVASLSFASDTGGQDGKPRGINDLGQITFHASFTDGSSGIFVSDALTVPEPGGLALAVSVMAGISMAGIRRVIPCQLTAPIDKSPTYPQETRS